MTVKTNRFCDFDSCGRYIEGAHSKYYHVTEFKQVSLSDEDNGPWDFCSTDCLAAWASLR